MKKKAEKETDLSQKVIKQIKKEKVKMRPKLFFVLASFLLGLGLIGTLITASLFFNLTFFRMRIESPLSFLWFGRSGLKPFLITFPWLPLLVGLGGLLSGLALLRRYDVSYKKSFLGLVIAFLVLVLGMAFVLDQFGFNERAEGVKGLRPLYPAKIAGEDWLVGEVIGLEEENLVIATPDGKEVTILKSGKTLLPLNGHFSLGDRVKVIGQWEKDVFVAKGIIKEPPPERMIRLKVKGVRGPRRF